MIDDKIDCCGCSACAIICPRKAIEMNFNAEGYYRPNVNLSLCVECGLCENVCPVLHPEARELGEKSSYVSVAKDRTILEKSSSGGVAYVFAKGALEQGWPVCGVAYNKESKQAQHIVVDELSDLYLIQGSKYLQSADYKAFDEIMKLECGIVFGTPCQIAGLDSVLNLKHKREKFILVDIFCHGVPNQLLWCRHLEYLRDKNKISSSDDVCFRKGKDFILTIGNYKAYYNQDAFYTFFLRGWLKNHKCYNCDYRRSSCADLRIGDCMADKFNTVKYSPSCIIANTSAGKAFLLSCKNDLELYAEQFALIDRIQEKYNMRVPDKYYKIIEKLRNGKKPEELIRYIMVGGRLKSIVKRSISKILSNKNNNELEDFFSNNSSD